MRAHGPLPAEATLVDLLRLRSREQPALRAYTFLEDGEQSEQSLTFAELDRQARRIGALLDSRRARGQPVLLLFPSCLEFICAFFGCLYAGAIPATVAPPRPNRSAERFCAIARDCGASVVLTKESLRARIEPSIAAVAGLAGLRWIAIDGAEQQNVDVDLGEPEATAASVAFLQYTSGSTASPKGTMVTHANILHNSRVIHEGFGTSERSIGVGWLPMTHDMGLIGNVIQPLYAAFPLVFMAPEHFLVKPIRWLRAVSRYRATITGGPNFAYDYCCERVTPEQRAGLDLGSWEIAFNGAERVRPATIDRFSAAFAAAGFRRDAFYPCYGLAESTLMVTGGARQAPAVRRTLNGEALKSNRAVAEPAGGAAGPELVGCGRPRAGQEVAIVDPDTRARRNDGEIGEIWVAGPSVAHGYWGRPTETENVFGGRLEDRPQQRYLRTGDLGFVVEGELFITGRLKDLLIVGGANHFPDDIEATVENAHQAIRQNGVAAVAVDVDGGERLVVVAEVERHHRPRASGSREEQQADSFESIKSRIRTAVAREHDLSAHAICLVRQATLPRTSSGKIQRHLCGRQYLESRLALVESGTLRAAAAGAHRHDDAEN